MDERPLSDGSLNREIAAALDVHPSPEFLARVRTRLAAEPAPLSPCLIRWHGTDLPLRWVTLAAVGVAIGLGIAPVVPDRDRAAAPLLPVVQSPSGDVPLPLPEPAAEGAAPVVTASARPRRPADDGPVRAGPVGDGLPEVLISRDEVNAFRLLVRRFHEDTESVTLPDARDPTAPVWLDPLPEPPEVSVDPIAIPPILELAALQPEGEHP